MWKFLDFLAVVLNKESYRCNCTKILNRHILRRRALFKGSNEIKYLRLVPYAPSWAPWEKASFYARTYEL